MNLLKKKMRWPFYVLAVTLLIFAPLRQAFADSKKHTISVGGLDRTYLLYKPASLKENEKVPLVIMMHGGFGTGTQAEKSYGWDKQSEAGHFIVAYPDGIRRSWNAGGICCGHAVKTNADDLGFISAIITDVSASENIDPKRVYLTGMSNGAAMAYRYACEGSYPVAAIGPVSGSLSTACKNPHTLSVMEIHGMQDTNIPFVGGIGTKGVTSVPWAGVQQTLDNFRKAMQCQTASVQHQGVVTTATSTCSEGNEVALITVDNAGHQWPGGEPPRRFATMLLPMETPSTAMNATSMLWAFFQKHQAP